MQGVVYRLLADMVAVVHGAFLLYVVLGGFVAWRWPRTIWLHVATVVWGIGIVVIGWECPLTDLEAWLAERGGESMYARGFVDRYVEGVVYPERLTPIVRAVALGLIGVSWYGFAARRRRRADMGAR
jgi:hypothetical protein